MERGEEGRELTKDAAEDEARGKDGEKVAVNHPPVNGSRRDAAPETAVVRVLVSVALLLGFDEGRLARLAAVRVGSVAPAKGRPALEHGEARLVHVVLVARENGLAAAEGRAAPRRVTGSCRSGSRARY